LYTGRASQQIVAGSDPARAYRLLDPYQEISDLI
jgi:hypothetical protein